MSSELIDQFVQGLMKIDDPELNGIITLFANQMTILDGINDIAKQQKQLQEQLNELVNKRIITPH